MPFAKGKTKTGGKTKGSVNKKTAILDAFAEDVVSGGIDKFKKELRTLKGSAYINAYLQLFEYVKPKLSRMEMRADVAATIKKVGYGKEE
jgi:hypothetical protein